MASEKGRQVMQWKTPNRVYLKALVTMGFILSVRGERGLVKFVERFVPNWRDEFRGENVHNLDNALAQRADKATRNDEFPSTAANIAIWETAMKDAPTGRCSFNFVVPIDSKKEDDDDIVKNIGSQANLVPAAGIIYKSGWNFVDIRARQSTMQKSPEEVEDFLSMLVNGRNRPFNDLPEPLRRLFDTVIDAYLYWKSKQ